MDVFTLGYQGSTLAAYITALEAAGINLVIDVRETPWSYKPGFSKNPLMTALQSAGIDYLHLKSAGNPSINRKTAKNSTECLELYTKHLKNNPECLQELQALILTHTKRKRRVCLTCFEKHPIECHRSILIDKLRKRMPDMSPVHLSL